VKKAGRYETSGLVENQFEPGTRGKVLKNLSGIRRKREMDRVEAQEQVRALEELSGIYDRNHRFTAADVCKIHKIWLGKIYEWAGKYRHVNVSKENFPFAFAKEVPRLMAEFEKGPLEKYTPCRFSSHEEIARAIAVVHTELVLIHPFREGNGRVARILSAMMALQAGLPPMDFGGIRKKKRQEYFSAVRAGLDNNYAPMEKIFSAVMRRTLRFQR